LSEKCENIIGVTTRFLRDFAHYFALLSHFGVNSGAFDEKRPRTENSKIARRVALLLNDQPNISTNSPLPSTTQPRRHFGPQTD
jgi:hypothetical protein